MGLEKITKELEETGFLEGIKCVAGLTIIPGAFFERARICKEKAFGNSSHYIVAGGFEFIKLYIFGSVIYEMFKEYL